MLLPVNSDFQVVQLPQTSVMHL